MKNDVEQASRQLGKVLGAVFAAALVALGGGCGDSLGECEVVCTFLSDGSTSYHGPYDDYTEAECDDQAAQSESPSITTCVGDWSSY